MKIQGKTNPIFCGSKKFIYKIYIGKILCVSVVFESCWLIRSYVAWWRTPILDNWDLRGWLNIGSISQKFRGIHVLGSQAIKICWFLMVWCNSLAGCALAEGLKQLNRNLCQSWFCFSVFSEKFYISVACAFKANLFDSEENGSWGLIPRQWWFFNDRLKDLSRWQHADNSVLKYGAGIFWRPRIECNEHGELYVNLKFDSLIHVSRHFPSPLNSVKIIIPHIALTAC